MDHPGNYPFREMLVAMIGAKTKTADVTAESALAAVQEWLQERRDDPLGPAVDGQTLALISIAASLIEIKAKLH